MTHRIEQGQIYYSLDPREETYGNGVRRIKIIGGPVSTPGAYGFGKAEVVTLTEDGREIRLRRIAVGQLHAGPIGKNGKKRVTGYSLE